MTSKDSVIGDHNLKNLGFFLVGFMFPGGAGSSSALSVQPEEQDQQGV